MSADEMEEALERAYVEGLARLKRLSERRSRISRADSGLALARQSLRTGQYATALRFVDDARAELSIAVES